MELCRSQTLHLVSRDGFYIEFLWFLDLVVLPLAQRMTLWGYLDPHFYEDLAGGRPIADEGRSFCGIIKT